MQRYSTACNTVHYSYISTSLRFLFRSTFLSRVLFPSHCTEPFVPRNAHIKLRGNLNQCEWFLFSVRHPWGTYEILEELSFLRHVQSITYFIISFFLRYRHWITACSVVLPFAVNYRTRTWNTPFISLINLSMTYTYNLMMRLCFDRWFCGSSDKKVLIDIKLWNIENNIR